MNYLIIYFSRNMINNFYLDKDKENFPKTTQIKQNVGIVNSSSDPEITEINKLIEILDFEGAKYLLEDKYKKEPGNVEVIDILSEVYFNLDEIEEAIHVNIMSSYI
jgi:hypothetical protein